MPRRITTLLVVALAFGLVGAASGDPGDEKASVDAEIGQLRDKIEGADRTAGVLTDEISAATEQITALEGDLAGEESELAALESQLAQARARLDALTTRLASQTERLQTLRREHAAAAEVLARRVRAIYMGDTPDAVSFVLGIDSFSDLIDNVEIMAHIGRQDLRIARRVERARDAARTARDETQRTRAEQITVTASVAARTSEQRAVRDRVAAARSSLDAARSGKRELLGSIEEDREHFLEEVAALEQESARLAALIQSAAGSYGGSTGSGTVSAAGFVWPVSGPVTSGFGMRWGRMHEGIDIAVASGTTVVAVAAGTVIHAGWLGGYGNLVVVDHGNGLSTAYAHNSSYAASVGQTVGQGQAIAYSGNTGNSSGPHVHFEVRVNGSAVDPLGYL